MAGLRGSIDEAVNYGGSTRFCAETVVAGENTTELSRVVNKLCNQCNEIVQRWTSPWWRDSMTRAPLTMRAEGRRQCSLSQGMGVDTA
jgi:hypothetical protein